jgi:ATP-binding cassette subfamily B protein
MKGALPFLLIMCIAYFTKEAVQVVRKVIVEKVCTETEKTARLSLISRLFQVDLNTLVGERIGSLNGRLHRSVDGLVRLLKLSFLDFFPVCFTAFFSLVVVIFRQPVLGTVMGLVVPVGGYIIFRQLASQKGIRIDLLKNKEDLDGTFVEQMGGIDYVRAANTYPHELAKVERITENLRRWELAHHIAMAFYDCAKSLNEGIFHIAIITASIFMALHKIITIGDVLTFSVLFSSVVNPLREIHRILDEAHESSLRVTDFFSMLAEPIDRSFQVATSDSPQLANKVPIISADHLQVTYTRKEDGQTVIALKDASFFIKTGETVGLAGPSGSGKSTFVRAILRLVHPASGELKLGGIPIECIDRGTIGNLIGFVSQTPFLFSGSIEENIAYGMPEILTHDIQKAATLAQIHNEIQAMPLGYKSQVAERGQNLSGGQRQRIALARVFLKNPPILILDEATAALDNENERAVMTAITAAMKGRTVVMVAHRLTSLLQTDRILVFNQGRVVEAGKFEDLAKIEGGVFAGLLHSGSGERNTLVLPMSDT